MRLATTTLALAAARAAAYAESEQGLYAAPQPELPYDPYHDGGRRLALPVVTSTSMKPDGQGRMNFTYMTSVE